MQKCNTASFATIFCLHFREERQEIASRIFSC